MSKEQEPQKKPTKEKGSTRWDRLIEEPLTPQQEAELYGTTLIMAGSKPNPTAEIKKQQKTLKQTMADCAISINLFAPEDGKKAKKP